MRISRVDRLMVGGLAEGLCGAVERGDAERGQLLMLHRKRSDGSDWLSWGGDLVPHDHILSLNLAHAIGQVDCVPFFDSLQCALLRVGMVGQGHGVAPERAQPLHRGLQGGIRGQKPQGIEKVSGGA